MKTWIYGSGNLGLIRNRYNTEKDKETGIKSREHGRVEG
jgi:hypothetical protein